MITPTLLFFIGIASVTSVFTDYDDALGISQEMGEETGNYSHSASKEQKEYYERINNVKLRYQASGKSVDALKIVSVFHTLNSHGAGLSYDKISESDIEFVADAMFDTLCLNFIFIYCVYKYCVLKKKMDGILNIYVIANMIIMAIIIAVSGKEILSGRLGGAMDINANVVALAMINCLVIAMHKNAKEKKAVNTIIMIICVGSILLTGSRKGLVGMALALVLYQVMDKGWKKYKNLFIVAVVMVFAYFLIMNVEQLYDIAGHRVEALLSYFKGEKFNEASLETRDRIAGVGWKYVWKSPWFGYGLNNFGILRGTYGLYSHNNYLELMFGCGIIGTSLYYLGYLYVLFGHLKLYLKHKVVDSKLYVILLVIQMFLEYAYVSYFTRKNLLFIIISLSALQIAKSKIQNGVKYNEQIEEGSQESL